MLFISYSVIFISVIKNKSVEKLTRCIFKFMQSNTLFFYTFYDCCLNDLKENSTILNVNSLYCYSKKYYYYTIFQQLVVQLVLNFIVESYTFSF